MNKNEKKSILLIPLFINMNANNQIHTSTILLQKITTGVDELIIYKTSHFKNTLVEYRLKISKP